MHHPAARWMILAAALAAGSAQADPALPVWNDTPHLSNPQVESWLREALPAGHLAAAQAPGRTLYVGVRTLRAGPQGTGALLCEAVLGLTHQPAPGLRPRTPSALFPALDRVATDARPRPAQVEACEGAALRSAIAAVAQAPLEEFTRGVEATQEQGGERQAGLPEDGARARLYLAGLPARRGAQAVLQALPDAFLQAYDYRRGAIVVQAQGFALRHRLVCFANAGLAGRYPDGRNARVPAVSASAALDRALAKPASPQALEACRTRAAQQALQQLLAQRWDEDELFSDYDSTREDGIELPDVAAIARAQASRP